MHPAAACVLRCSLCSMFAEVSRNLANLKYKLGKRRDELRDQVSVCESRAREIRASRARVVDLLWRLLIVVSLRSVCCQLPVLASVFKHECDRATRGRVGRQVQRVRRTSRRTRTHAPVPARHSIVSAHVLRASVSPPVAVRCSLPPGSSKTVRTLSATTSVGAPEWIWSHSRI